MHVGLIDLLEVERSVDLNVGMWRSMVAHFTGGEGVAGSNPVIPTKFCT